MLRFLYSLLLILTYIPYSIAILIRIFFKKEHKSKFKEKLFFNKIERPSGFIFWFHVASLGEFNSILPIVDYYIQKDEKYKFLITTVTLSSYNELKKKYGKNKRIFHQFLPYDLNLFTNYFLNSWKPDIVSFVDSEIWPNFIFNIKKRNIPIVLLNARITKKTFKRWLFLKKFSKTLFGLFSICIASSKESQEYLSLLQAKKIKYYGNIKFCSASQDDVKIDEEQFQNIKNKKIWCAISTHNDEEIFCSKVQEILNRSEKNSMCIIIPRHVHRNKGIFSKLSKMGFKLQIKNENDKIDKAAEIVLINYYGAVNTFLRKIKNVFIGKSLVKKLIKVGGQNPIEAAKMGCYIFHGPYVYNFAEIYRDLKNKEFSEEINYPEELANKLLRNFGNDKKLVDGEKIKELEIYSNSIFKNTINEYEILINENT
jgi:3-deoxy-D-manno-octulosonic-acid transferase